ncbi:hypothetical protein V3565_00380 [Bartonella sp. B10]
MKLSKILRSSAFVIIVICISTIVTDSVSEVFYNPHCQSFEYFFNKDITKPGQNSFTASQIKNRLRKNGFENVKRLRLDDQGIWRALVKFNHCHFLVSIDYSGIINIQNGRKEYD